MWDPRLHYMPYSLIQAVAWELTLNLMDSFSRNKPNLWGMFLQKPFCMFRENLIQFCLQCSCGR